uniref:Uncharacterized protein n=1 Tax=Meloidogyne enterolobii TaxID=390850 RepID=A0A6V7V1P8_MELEN|nr:unnamed protein product [Meloidogyne enterolobii]
MSRILPLRISSSLQSKFRQLHNQIHQPNLSTEFDPELLASSSNDKKPNLWRLITAKLNFNEKSLLCFMQKQLFFAQCLKLLVLFFVAIAQILYLHPFLELFLIWKSILQNLNFYNLFNLNKQKF